MRDTDLALSRAAPQTASCMWRNFLYIFFSSFFVENILSRYDSVWMCKYGMGLFNLRVCATYRGESRAW